MKKFYSLVLVLLTAPLFAQSVVITRVVDGTFSNTSCAGTGSAPKFVELYVSGTVDLSYYRVQTEANGAANAGAISWNQGTYLNDLGTVSNSFVYLVYGAPDTVTVFSSLFPGITANVLQSTNTPNMNGNDALRVVLYDAPAPAGTQVSVVDQFGDPLDIANGTNDYSAPWAYQDSYAKRNNSVAANGGNFVTGSFTYGGNGALTTSDCGTFPSIVGLGQFTLAAESFDAISGLTIYPNPVTGGVLNITSNSNADKTVAVFDVLGKQVLNAKVTEGTVNVSALTSGVYIVKITEEGKTATRKLVVK